MLTHQQTELIKTVTKKYKPTMLAVFGSYARGEATPESDLDLLIEFESSVHLLELIGLEQELSELLGVKVDLITHRSLSAYIKPHIEADLVSIV